MQSLLTLQLWMYTGIWFRYSIQNLNIDCLCLLNYTAYSWNDNNDDDKNNKDMMKKKVYYEYW